VKKPCTAVAAATAKAKERSDLQPAQQTCNQRDAYGDTHRKVRNVSRPMTSIKFTAYAQAYRTAAFRASMVALEKEMETFRRNSHREVLGVWEPTTSKKLTAHVQAYRTAAFWASMAALHKEMKRVRRNMSTARR
jgi:hypothetical protein